MLFFYRFACFSSQSSTGSSGTSKRRRTAKTTCRKRLVSTIFEGPEDVDNNRAGEKRTEATKTTSGAAAADEDFYAWLDECKLTKSIF